MEPERAAGARQIAVLSYFRSAPTIERLLYRRSDVVDHAADGWPRQGVCMLQFGVMADDLAKRNMEMFAAEVMPYFR